MSVDLLARVAGPADRVVLVTPDRTWSLAELDAEVDAAADGLADARPGTVLPMVTEADAHGLVRLLGAWRRGLTVAPLNARLTEVELAAARGALEGSTSRAQAILWTSGTSGSPRGVAISFENLEASARGAADRLALGPEDVWLASLSPAHVGGLALVTRALLLGSRLVLAGPFDAAGTVALVRGTRAFEGFADPVSHASVVPTQLIRLLDAVEDSPAPPTFRCALVGGAMASADLVGRALRASWPIALTYGMTEATSQVATADPELVARKPGTVGPPLAGVEVRVEGDEILVRGPTVALGYVGGVHAAVSDAEGWLHTGDMGRIDADGDLWITGRRIDRIVSGGVTVDASEVEETLRAHDDVADACVVGLADEEWGERVAACVVAAAGRSIDVATLEGFVRPRLSPPKRPKVYRVVPALPRNVNGKVDRGAVRDAFRPGG